MFQECYPTTLSDKEHYWTKKLSDKEYMKIVLKPRKIFIPTVSNKEHYLTRNYRKKKSSDKESYLTKKTKRKLSKK